MEHCYLYALWNLILGTGLLNCVEYTYQYPVVCKEHPPKVKQMYYTSSYRGKRKYISYIDIILLSMTCTLSSAKWGGGGLKLQTIIG